MFKIKSALLSLLIASVVGACGSPGSTAETGPGLIGRGL